MTRQETTGPGHSVPVNGQESNLINEYYLRKEGHLFQVQ